MAIMILFLLLLVVGLSCMLNAANAQAQPSIRNATIKLGSSLSTTNTNTSFWASESGHFAFGFYPKGNGFFYVGLWFQNIPQKTLVWTANRDDPPFPGDATLLLTSNGVVVQHSQPQQETIIANASAAAASASVLDSGNLVLFNSSSAIIWQSFDFPTDTLLPSQRLLPPHKLVANLSPTNHSTGKFSILMQTDGNLVFYPIQEANQYTAYWDTQTFTAGNNVTLNLDGNGQLYLQRLNGSIIKNVSDKASLTNKAVHRATIDADGIFRLYSHTLNPSDDWSIEWWRPVDKCSPTGLCGLNSYCGLVLNDPVCQCLSGFDYIDQAHKNSGCSRNVSVDACATSKGESKTNLFDVHELVNVTWDNDAYSILSPVEKDACREECLEDCNCEAALYKGQSCSMLKLPLRFGKNVSAGAATSFVKISAKEGKTRKHKRLRMDIFIVSITCLTVAYIVTAATGFLLHRSRIRGYERILNVPNDRFVEDATLKSFTYEELKMATNNFKDEIGKGAYCPGTVFRGVIPNSNRIVAIKRLEKVVDEGERDFRNEMKAIGKTHHKNLVQLLGYCYDGTNRLLVYEYMKNGSLADFLFKSNLKVNWEGRTAIAMNIARGLFYLHEECETQIIHCDIKPENILMDDKGYAKIADFGLAKLLMPSQTKTYTGIRGTRGYVAPEWHRNLPITVKADVYSFGIMLFEIICCRRSVEANVPEHEAVLAHWVYDCYKANEVEELVRHEEVEKSKVERMVKVGLWCTQDEASSRPSMKKVILMMEGTMNIPDPPLLSSFVSSP